MTDQDAATTATAYPCPLADPHDSHDYAITDGHKAQQLTCPGVAGAAAPEPDPVPPGLEELLAWLTARTPMVARARIAQAVVKRIEDEAIDPAVVYAWEHRSQSATMRDLSNATGLNMARITWALRRHPRSDT